MNEHEKLREQMWDLVYGLTSADETAALHARIKSDRATARMYAEVRLEADLIAEAAKVDDTSVTLPQMAPQKERVAAGRTKEASNAPAASGTSPGWSLHWLGAIAASALAVLMAVGIFWRQEQPRSGQGETFLITVYSDTQLVAGLPVEMEVRAKDAAEGRPAAGEFEYQIARADGTPLYEQQFKTDDEGRSRLHVPADYIDPGNKFLMYSAEPSLPEQQVAQQADGVTAPRNDATEAHVVRDLDRVEARRNKKSKPLVEATLDVRADPLKTQLSFNQDWYEPGDTVEFRAHIASAFTQQPPDVRSLALKLVDRDGNAIAAEETQPHPETGVVTGRFHLPPEAKEGAYGLSIHSKTRGEQRTDAVVQVGRDFSQVEMFSRYQSDFRELAAADVKQQDGTKLKKGVDLSRDASAGIPPREVEGRGPDSDKADAAIAAKASGGRPAGGPADPTRLTRGVPPPPPAENAPAPGGKKNAVEEPKAPALAGTFAESASASNQPLDELRLMEDSKKLSDAARTTLELSPPPQLAGKPLLVEARHRQIVIGKLEVPAEASVVQEKLTEEEAENERLGRRLSLALPPQISGPVHVYYFDNSVNPPVQVQAQLYDIPPRNEFDVALGEAETIYAPGQTVRFKVQISDRGQAASNVSFGYKVAPLLAMAPADDEVASQRGGESNSFQKQSLESRIAPTAEAKEGEEASQGRRLKANLGAPLPKTDQDALAEVTPTPAPVARGALGPVARGGAKFGAETNGALVNELEMAQEKDGSLAQLVAAGDQTALLVDDWLEAEQLARPMLLASNEDAVRRAQGEQQAAEAAREARIGLWRHWLGKGLLLGGVVLLVVLGIGVYLQRPSQVRAWVPSLAIAAASFLVGLVWMIQHPSREEQVIARRESTIADREAPRPMSMPKGDVAGTATTEEPSTKFDAPAPTASEPATPFAGGMGGAASGGFGGGGRDMPVPAAPRSAPAAPGGPSDRAELSDLTQAGVADKRMPDAAAKSSLDFAPSGGAENRKKRSDDQPVEEGAERKDSLDRNKELRPESAGEAPARRSRAAARTANKASGEDLAKNLAKNLEMKAEKYEQSGVRLQAGQKAERQMAESIGQKLASPGGEGARLFKVLGDGEARTSGSIWVPLLEANENGEAVIEFTMPQQPGNYKLILDVLGPGRTTQIEKLIRCEVPQPAAPAAPAADEPKP